MTAVPAPALTAGPDDGLAVPVDPDARPGAGCRRAIVLGGGGLVFVTWLVAYLRRLHHHHGVDLHADRVVGTSAGSVVASLLVGGHLHRADLEVGLLRRAPGIVAALAPAAELSPSQLRAVGLFLAAGDARPETVRAIGHAALAAAAPPPTALPRSLRALLPSNRWPGDALVITATDAYTGERLVLTRAAKVPVRTAAAASSSVPGIFSPQPIGDRRAMDGGVAGSGTHADLVAGADRALVVAFAAEMAEPRMAQSPGGLSAEIAALAATGTEVELRASRIDPTTNLMDPAQLAGAFALGETQADEDAAGLAAFLGA